MTENFALPTDYRINQIDIDGKSVVPLFLEIEIFENIFLGGVTGSITLTESDAAGYLEEDIQFVESIQFSFTNANGEELVFDGYLNGLRNKVVKPPISIYTIDFCSKSVRMNEMIFVTRRFKDENPEDIASKMVEKLVPNSKINSIGNGVAMNFIGSRRKPLQIMKYVLSHAISEKSDATNEQDKDSVDEESKGTCGFLFWETLDGYRFAAVDDLLEGNEYTNHSKFKLNVNKKSLPMKEAMLSIISYEFPHLGDFQSKLRSGAFKSKLISFDIDTGNYKEYTYDASNEKNVTTDKQYDLVKEVTRYVYKLYNNERMQVDCKKAKNDDYDQSRKNIQQSMARQNSFVDQHGRLILSPQYTIRAGDSIDILISKISSDDTPSKENKKHSGRYVCKQISHHIFSTQKSYTKVGLIRSSNQPDEDSAQ